MTTPELPEWIDKIRERNQQTLNYMEKQRDSIVNASELDRKALLEHCIKLREALEFAERWGSLLISNKALEALNHIPQGETK